MPRSMAPADELDAGAWISPNQEVVPLKRFLKEPLVHFTVLALTIFAAYGLVDRRAGPAPDRIVVTAPKIEQLAAIFARIRQRPPRAEELKGLIDDYVKEEIYVREALVLGLDEDDAVIRRRLRLKMEFLDDAVVDALAPTESELDTYLRTHAADFQVDSMLAFQHVFLSPERHGEKVAQQAASVLELLLTDPAIDTASLGDATLLPGELPLSSKTAIAQTFGDDFAEAVDTAMPGRWTGPIESSFGVHLVRVSERRPGYVPALAEVRDAVAREWVNARRREIDEARFKALLDRYQVSIEGFTQPSASP